MQDNLFNNNKSGNSYSVRKIPVSAAADRINSSENTDKIKILEFSSLIDSWEKEILFSEKGFYSLKGKEIENKSKEYLDELNNFINSNISKINFADSSSLETIYQIKNSKYETIKKQMALYEQNEIYNWELQVYENAINSAIERAVLYKSDPQVITSAFSNGLSIIKLMAEKEKWDNKLLNRKKDEYKSNFYYSLIDAFVREKDIKASLYFDKYKEFLKIDNKEKLETAIEELKNNIIAYNWAKEVFSYKLSNEELEKKINAIKNEKIEKIVRLHLSNLKHQEKRIKDREEKDNNIKNWDEIKEILQTQPDRAFLYIDYTADLGNIKIKKDYVKQILKSGSITTDKKKFIDLLQEYFEDFEKFKKKDISDYIQCFSEEDYDLFLQYQKIKTSEFESLFFDYEYIKKIIKDAGIKKTEDIYNFIKLLINSLKEYESINNKKADLEQRSKIIKTVAERFKDTDKKKIDDKQKNKEQSSKNINENNKQ